MIPDKHPTPAQAVSDAAPAGEQSVDLMEVRSWCASALNWKTLPDRQRVSEAAHQMRQAYWALAREIDSDRVPPAMVDDCAVVLARGRELVGDLDAAVAGAQTTREQQQGLRHLLETAMKVRGLCGVLSVQRQGEPATAPSRSATTAHPRSEDTTLPAPPPWTTAKGASPQNRINTASRAAGPERSEPQKYLPPASSPRATGEAAAQLRFHPRRYLMIKEGKYTFIDGQTPVIPFKGKYAVMVEDPFTLIRSGWKAAGLADDAPYRPLRVEFELTDRCNDRCASCGMGAKPVAEGVTLSDAQLDRLVAQFADVGLPSVAITGGEPFVSSRALYRFMELARGTVDIGKITTNGIWGTEKGCRHVFERLAKAGLLDNRIFVPLLMVSIGEQTTPLDRIARIIHYVVTQFTDRELNIAVSSLADPADRTHRIYELLALYEQAYGEFPHERVHSTMRVYLENERLENQAPIRRPGETTVTRWMTQCYDCFAPTVGTYVLPCALMKVNGDLYSCAAFNVPDKLGFGNVFEEPLADILSRVNSSRYVRTVRDGGGLKGVSSVVPPSVTDQMTCGSFCGSCNLLIDRFEDATGHPEPGSRRRRTFIPLSGLSVREEPSA